MAKELTWREAIDRVLSESSVPMHYKEITDKIVSDKLRVSLGATPAYTVNAQISSSIKHDAKSPYVRVAKGHICPGSGNHSYRADRDGEIDACRGGIRGI